MERASYKTYITAIRTLGDKTFLVMDVDCEKLKKLDLTQISYGPKILYVLQWHNRVSLLSINGLIRADIVNKGTP